MLVEIAALENVDTVSKDCGGWWELPVLEKGRWKRDGVGDTLFAVKNRRARQWRNGEWKRGCAKMGRRRDGKWSAKMM